MLIRPHIAHGTDEGADALQSEEAGMKQTIKMLIAVLALTAPAISQKQTLQPALAALVATERAFARTCGEKGYRASFLEFFADDGISFQPHPVNTRETLSKLPAAPPGPLPVTINWEPVYADISRAGDLGYTTGPYAITDNTPQQRPSKHGYFFSVWKKQDDGNWKVMLDLGVDTPAPTQPIGSATLQSAPQTRWKQLRASHNPDAQQQALINLEREFSRASMTLGIVPAYERYLRDDARLNRDGVLPIVGREAIRSYLSHQNSKTTWEPIKSFISTSLDFGYAYGSYETVSNSQKSETVKGYYARVWRRGADGRWRVVMDVMHQLPQEEK